jgi:hypothetical protein
MYIAYASPAVGRLADGDLTFRSPVFGHVTDSDEESDNCLEPDSDSVPLTSLLYDGFVTSWTSSDATRILLS